MTHAQAVEYILRQLDELAKHCCPGSKQEQAQWAKGFLAAQLAEAMQTDSKNYAMFKARVQALGLTKLDQ